MSSHTTMKSNDGVDVRRVVETPNPNARLLEQILSRENMRYAWKRAKANKEAPGIDKMPIEKFPDFARDKWDSIRESLSDGSYQPLPVKRVEIAKPMGGKRPLGIPAALDRVVQQATAQVLAQIWDYTFSEYSYGFRPKRSQADAIRQYRKYVRARLRYVIDDDSVIFVKSKRAASRVMESVSRFIDKKLRLEVNRDKSAVGRPWDRKDLGFCMTNSRKNPKIRIHWKTIKRFRERVREITARRRGCSIKQVINELSVYMQGWWGYYRIVQQAATFAAQDQASSSSSDMEAMEKSQNTRASAHEKGRLPHPGSENWMLA